MSRRWKRILKILDHCGIYLLIAGTYTPFTLVSLHSSWGWILFGILWGLALAGILFKICFVDPLMIASTMLYLLMGWLVVIAIRPLLDVAPVLELMWLWAGGLSYTAGIAFFAWHKLPYTIWHMFVMAGSVCHYVAILHYVAPLQV